MPREHAPPEMPGGEPLGVSSRWRTSSTARPAAGGVAATAAGSRPAACPSGTAGAACATASWNGSLPVGPYGSRRAAASVGARCRWIGTRHPPPACGDVGRLVARQEEDGLRQFLLQPVAVQRDRIMVVAADFRRVHRLGHGGVHGPRRHRIHPDAEAGQFRRLLLRQMRQRRLAGPIGNPQRGGAEPRDGGDVHHRAPAPLRHDRRRRLHRQEGPRQVHRQHAVPFLQRRFEHRLEHRGAGIVHQRVQPPEMPRRALHGGHDRGRVRHVADQRQRVVRRGKGRHRPIQQPGIEVQQRHAPPLRQEALRGGKADAPPRARHQRDR